MKPKFVMWRLHWPRTTGVARWASTSPQSAKVRKILRRQVLQPPSNVMPCVAASRCDQYNLAKVVSSVTGEGIFARLLEGNEFAHFKYKKDSDVLVLANGVLVAWGVGEPEVLQKVLPLLKRAEISPSKLPPETEDMDFVEEETPANIRSGMIGDVIYLHGPSTETRTLDKLAFSSGLARHTKLCSVELEAEHLIQQVRMISSQMAAGEQTDLRQKDVEKLTGRLLQLRGALNLYSQITETPDLYWSAPEQETLFELISRKLDIEPRVEILNKKLDYVAEMVGILRSHLSEKNSVRLEWMVIILIMIEVAIEVRRLVFENATEEETVV